MTPAHRTHDKPVINRKPLALGLAFSLILVAAILGGVLAGKAYGRPTEIKPIPAPAALVKARAACPNTATPPQCRSALFRAYAAIDWERKARLELAREMLGNVADWTCIHNGKGATRGTGEGSWTASTGNGYFGGLQMDRGFMRTYGADMIRRHHGGLANTWTPREQIIVAERARASGRGYTPWPNTGRACGLVT